VRRNSLVVLVVALVMGGVAAFLARDWLERHSRASAATEQFGTIVVAAKPLGFGTAIVEDGVIEIPWAARTLPDGAFSTKRELLADGRRVVLSSIQSKEPILQSKITGPGQRASLSTLLQQGRRAVAVRVDDVRGVAGFILPGDFVDVVLIQAEQGAPGRRENWSEILLEDVKVLAVDQLANERQEQPTVAKAVTLEVTAEQAQKILLATNVGKLSLILRRPGDNNPQFNKRVTEKDLSQGPHGEVVVRPPAPPPPSPPPVAAPVRTPDNVSVSVVRGVKREDYSVAREGR
jgi:pilus assembly protein CpaB